MINNIFKKNKKIGSVLNLFPDIGMYSNKKTFTTHNQANQINI